MKIDIINESEDGMNLEFDLIHVEAPIANTLRRVLLAEVVFQSCLPTFLIQKTI